MDNRQFRNYALFSGVVALGTYLIIRQFVNWHPYFLLLIALSTATFLLYGFDKEDAEKAGMEGRQAQERVPKKLLHLLALLGGFVGGWLGMIVFKHKFRRADFLAILSIRAHSFMSL